MNADAFAGSCFCGAVQFVVAGQPIAMGYCHCESCRHWSAGPVNAFTLWTPDSLSITLGAAEIGTYSKTPKSRRQWCVVCGGHLFTEHPAIGLFDVYAATIPHLEFEPALHINYRETVLHILDGLPKLRDLPADMGGSGIELPE